MDSCQMDDPEIRVCHTVISGLQHKDISYVAQGATFLYNVSTGYPNPFFLLGGDIKF